MYKMNGDIINGLLYTLVGTSQLYYFQVRRRELTNLHPRMLPELDRDTFADLKILLKMVYERTLYLGVLFFPLAFVSFRGAGFFSKLFFLLLIALLFIANIPPRHKIIRLLRRHGLTVTDLRRHGIRI